MRSTRSWRALVFPVIVTLLLTPFMLAQFPAVAQGQAGAEQIAGQSAPSLTPTRYAPRFSTSPQAPSAAQLAAVETERNRIDAAWRNRTVGKDPGVAGSPQGVPETPAAGISPNAPGTYTIFRTTAVAGAPAGFKSNVAEPAVAQSGKQAWLTHNWYAARSADGGVTWTYVSPFTDMADFCCDQDAIYDRGRDIIIWYRQGIYNTAPAPAGQNRIKIGVSTNGGVSWCTYTFSPVNINGAWTTQWFDYPQVYLTNNYLYFTSNMFSGAGSFLRMFVGRWSLDTIRACLAVSTTYWTKTTGWSWTGAQGGRSTFYLGDNSFGSTTFYIGSIPDATTTLTAVSRTITAFLGTNRDGLCPGPTGTNPCLRADQRITNGWVRWNPERNVVELGFAWNVKQGGSFPKPYVYVFLFNVTSALANLAYAPMWNSGTTAFQYFYGSPNVRGALGFLVYEFNTAVNPKLDLGIDDDYNGNPAPWSLFLGASSTGAPAANVWGDYSRVRYHAPQGTGFVAAGFTSTGSSNNTQPRYIVFGRDRDRFGILRFIGL
ncbi:MAG TPA: hypothetical protein VGK88_06700 [bacterium]